MEPQNAVAAASTVCALCLVTGVGGVDAASGQEGIMPPVGVQVDPKPGLRPRRPISPDHRRDLKRRVIVDGSDSDNPPLRPLSREIGLNPPQAPLAVPETSAAELLADGYEFHKRSAVDYVAEKDGSYMGCDLSNALAENPVYEIELDPVPSLLKQYEREIERLEERRLWPRFDLFHIETKLDATRLHQAPCSEARADLMMEQK